MEAKEESGRSKTIRNKHRLKRLQIPNHIGRQMNKSEHEASRSTAFEAKVKISSKSIFVSRS